MIERAMGYKQPARKDHKAVVPFIGTAGWTIPRREKAGFPDQGSHLERYASYFNAVEINSSFHRLHKPATYRRWAESVPSDFRFSVKLPRTITHDAGLQKPAALLNEFLTGVTELGDRLGPLLVQLPPSFVFEKKIAGPFFKIFRKLHKGLITCEPRHKSWFEEAAEDLLADYNIGRVAADPAPVPAAAEPGGDPRCSYFRLHGSPEIYRSSYGDKFLAEIAKKIALHPDTKVSWCIFDNTTLGFATPNAKELKQYFAEKMRRNR